MSVTQVHEALGSFEFELLSVIPREVLDNIQHFDHIAVIPGRIDPRQYGDGCLDAARYVGVIRRKKYADDGRTNLIQDDIRISGVGMEFWLGDDDGKGNVIESPVEFNGATFSTVLNTLRPSSVGAGTIHSVSGSYAGRHVYETPRDAIKYVCQIMSTESVPVGYKVTNSAKLDAGPEANLYVTNPTCLILRKGNSQGEDMYLRSLPSTVDMDIDMEDFATRVVMLAESDGDTLATGTADIGTVAPGVNVYKDLFGNALSLTKLVNESDTLEENADKRAEIALRSVMDPHRTLTISTDDYDVHGTFEVGDYIYIYDPDGGLIDLNNEVTIRGLRVNPLKLRVTEMDFPITEGYTVAHRDRDGNWTDLSDYVHWEEEQPSQVVIGDFARDLTGRDDSISTRTGAVVPPNSTIPAAPAWVEASFQAVNYVDSQGNPKARQKLVWNTPLNTNGSAITDGSHYEIQYRLDAGSQYSQTWAAASTLTWDQLNTWDQPVEPDDTPWQTVVVPWGDTSVVIHELPVGTGFDSRIRAVDTGNNTGDWSLTATWITSEDNIPPSTPAAPVVAGSKIAIQVVHELGMASGGTFNLENDLAHLEVHYSQDEAFFPTDESLVGRLRADKGMMIAQTAAVGTFSIPETDTVYVKVVAVDTGGNRSNASVAAPVTAELLDSAHISELTASKITAGTLGADIILGASIKTGTEGQRVELNYQGLQAFDVNGDLTVNISSDPSGGDFISLTDVDGNTVANISEAGDASFTNVYANEDLYIGGNSVTENLDRRPRGIVAISLAPNTSANTTSGGAAGGVVWNRLVIENFDPTRQYKLGFHFRADVASVNPDYVACYAYYSWDAVPTNTAQDGILAAWQIGGRDNSTADELFTGEFVFSDDTPDGTDFHIGMYLLSDVAGVSYQGTSIGRAWIEDVGPRVPHEVFDPNVAGGGGSGGQNGGSAPPQQRTKTYTSTWTRSYQGDGSLRISNGDMYQGYYSGTNGNQRSLIGFNDDQIRSDLSGATINKVEVRLDNQHFYYNSGGVACIGTHNYGGAPSTWSGSRVDEIRQTFNWAKGAVKWVTVSNTFGTDLRDGTATGLALGPGVNTSLTYYGFFAGQNGTYKPQIRITYTK